MSKYVKICQNMSKYVKICQNMSKYVKICQNMSKYVKICQTANRANPHQACHLRNLKPRSSSEGVKDSRKETTLRQGYGKCRCAQLLQKAFWKSKGRWLHMPAVNWSQPLVMIALVASQPPSSHQFADSWGSDRSSRTAGRL